jgi:hypothetical protein
LVCAVIQKGFLLSNTTSKRLALSGKDSRQKQMVFPVHLLGNTRPHWPSQNLGRDWRSSF